METYANEGDEVTVGGPLFAIVAGQGSAPAAATPKTSTTQPAAVEPAKVAAPSAPTPSAKVATPAPAPVSKAPVPKTSAGAPAAPLGDRSETRVKMSRMRIRIAQRLKEAQNTAAMLTTFQEVDMTELIALRNRHKDAFEKTHGVKLGFMSAFVKVRKSDRCNATVVGPPQSQTLSSQYEGVHFFF